MNCQANNTQELLKSAYSTVRNELAKTYPDACWSGGDTTGHVAAVLLGAELSTFYEYLLLLESWTEKIDLVAPAMHEVLVDKHFADAIAASLLIRSHLLGSGARLPLIDLGSGAGFPGIVCALLEPERAVTLCEPREKRVVFLKEVRRRLGISNLDIIGKRMEELEMEHYGAFGLCICRAFGDEQLFLETSANLLRASGYAIKMAGPNWLLNPQLEQKVQELKFSQTLSYTLPFSGAKRKLAVWKAS